MKKVGVVICNYNKQDMVLECIQAVLDSKFEDFDLYVVDNASSDDSVKEIKKKYDGKLELIVNSQNLGGSGGFNAGLRKAYKSGHEYLMCIDNDAFIDERAIGELVKFLDEHKEVGIAASKIYHMEEPDFVQNFGQKINFDYFCTEVNYLNAYEDGSMPEVVYTDSVPACSLMIRRSVVDIIGFMPEKNFLYWDDTEWCYLCNKNGYKVASVAASQALHSMGAKKEAVNTFPTYYGWRNWISFFIKYVPEEKLEQMVDMFLNSMFQVQFEGLYNQEYNNASTVMAAYDDALHGITGKAGENRIFDIDFNKNNYRRLFSKNNSFIINENEFPNLCEKVCSLAKEINSCIKLEVNRDNIDLTGCKGTIIELCESIFDINNAEIINHNSNDAENHYYIDVNDCIINEKDVLKVLNEYNVAQRLFIFENKSLFIRQAKKLRTR